MKINCSGRINSIELGSVYLTVFYKDHTIAYLRGFRVGHFLNKYHEDLGQEAILAIEKYFKKTLVQFKSSTQPTLTVDDCLRLFERIFELISQKKGTAKKPLLILIGEEHVSSHALLIEMIVFDIAQNFGLENFFIEDDEENLQFIKSGTNMNRGETCTRWDFLFHVISAEKCNIIPIDPVAIKQNHSEIEDLKQRIQRQVILHEELIVSAVEEKKESLLNQLSELENDLKYVQKIQDEITTTRDQHMSSRISSFAATDSKIKLAIVGAGHLKGIYENLTSSNDYTILPILAMSEQDCNNINQRFISPRELFFMSNPLIEKIFINKDCDIHNNYELFKMVNDASLTFFNMQINFLRNESKEIDELLNKFAGTNNVPHGYFVEIQEVWAESCHKLQLGRDGIIHAMQNPDVMRYELKELLKDVLNDMTVIMKYKAGNLKLMNLFSALSDLSQKFENGNYQIKNLNPAERQQLSPFTQKI